MRRRHKVALVVVVVLSAAFVVAQVIPPERTNPAIDVTRTLQAVVGTESRLATVVARACDDCHSNGTVWARYSTIAPLSWLIARGVSEGRKAVNFSEWATYSADERRSLLEASCKDASNGTMPIQSYLLVRPEAKLSAQDIEVICAASRQAEPDAASGAPAPSRSAR